MKRVLKFALAAVVVVGLSGLSINKILEEKTTDCVDEVAELTKASDVLGVILLAPNEETAGALSSAITEKTTVSNGAAYLTVAALGSDGFTVYVKVLLENGKTYSPAIEEEVKQIKTSMHRDSMRCSMSGKKFEIYRAKTTLSLIQKMSANPI
jgi:hypothetical protein